jgi:hypothetical protein
MRHLLTRDEGDFLDFLDFLDFRDFRDFLGDFLGDFRNFLGDFRDFRDLLSEAYTGKRQPIIFLPIFPDLFTHRPVLGLHILDDGHNLPSHLDIY